MAKNDYIFVDESGDAGYKVDTDTGELLSTSYYVLATFHVTDQSIRCVNQHIAAFRFYTGFNRELKFPPEKERFDRLIAPISELAADGEDIFSSVVHLNKLTYTGNYLKSNSRYAQSTQYFRNRVLRCLLEHHFASYELKSDWYELILDRTDMTPDQVRGLREYLRRSCNAPQPRYITHASSIYVEGLQVVDHIARGFKNVVEGGDFPDSLAFVKEHDITKDREVHWKRCGPSQPPFRREPA